jgi:lipoic acid synthetase
MKYIVVPETKETKQLPYYFAIEEYVARHFIDDEYFFIWQVEPTVMLGRNQLINSEVNTEYCLQKGVHIYRRKSGGGCVYADKGCLQFSYISSDEGVNFAFDKYIRMVAFVLSKLGISASSSGRNDVTVDGRKVAGSAFYKMPGRSVLHNTLLFDTNLEELVRCLTPSNEKLVSKGVESVRQRVANLSEFVDLSIDELIQHVREQLCGTQARVLTEEDMKGVAELEKIYASDNFIYGNNPKYTVFKQLRTEGVGDMEARIELKNNVIVQMNLVGDYFLIGDIDHELLDRLRGVTFDREAVATALSGLDMGSIIRNFTTERFLRLLFGRPPHIARPEWLKISITSNQRYVDTKRIIQMHKLNTICTSGRCPNQAECWGAGTATFMIGGDICTRCCRFCNTQTGKPLPLDDAEPERVAESVRLLKLKYAVLTSVDRDDLPDLGAAHWAKTIQKVKAENPDTIIEVLIPDFQGRKELIKKVVDARPDVVAHNMETVRRLTPNVRSAAQYERSLDVLREIAQLGVCCKTGIMVGLGETIAEVEELMDDVRATGCQILTIGQYLQPTYHHLAVAEYVTPEQFERYKATALQKGFSQVESGPLVRSSYHAAEITPELLKRDIGKK